MLLRRPGELFWLHAKPANGDSTKGRLCLDYCGTLYHGLPACRIGSLNRVLHTAARLVGCIPKFGHVSEYIQNELHWLSYPHRIAYRVSALVRRCIECLALHTCVSSVAPPRKSSAAAVSALPRKWNLLFPARRLPLSSTVPFLLLALRPGMGFPSFSAKYPLIAPSPSSLPSRPLCLTEAGLGALLSRQS